jgi:hypothetical protein
MESDPLQFDQMLECVDLDCVDVAAIKIKVFQCTEVSREETILESCQSIAANKQHPIQMREFTQ